MNIGYGISLHGSSNNIIRNNITNNLGGIWSGPFSNNNSIIGNSIKNSTEAVSLSGSNNKVVENDVVSNIWGIRLLKCLNSSVVGNNVISNIWGIFLNNTPNSIITRNMIINNERGIHLVKSSNNRIIRNSLVNNHVGIWIDYSSNNFIYHNNFLNNTKQVFFEMFGYPNIWDNGYPSGGNYWSDYTGADYYSGPEQDKLGGDGIGDMYYIIDYYNEDRYPLTTLHPMSPVYIYVSPGDFGPPKMNIRICGGGFTPRTSVTIYFDEIILGETTTNSDGNFYSYFKVPEVKAGLYTILARDAEGISASTTFRVTTPHLAIESSSGPIGTKITVWGSGLGPRQLYTIKFDDIVLVTFIVTTEKGLLPELSVTVPASTVGIHRINLAYITLWPEITYEIITFTTFNVTIGIVTTENLEKVGKRVEYLISEVKSLNIKLDNAIKNLNMRISDEITRLSESLSSLDANIGSIVNELSSLAANLTEVNTRFENQLAGLNLKITRLERELDSARNLAGVGVVSMAIAMLALVLSTIALRRSCKD